MATTLYSLREGARICSTKLSLSLSFSLSLSLTDSLSLSDSLSLPPFFCSGLPPFALYMLFVEAQRRLSNHNNNKVGNGRDKMRLQGSRNKTRGKREKTTKMAVINLVYQKEKSWWRMIHTFQCMSTLSLFLKQPSALFHHCLLLFGMGLREWKRRCANIVSRARARAHTRTYTHTQWVDGCALRIETNKGKSIANLPIFSISLSI